MKQFCQSPLTTVPVARYLCTLLASATLLFGTQIVSADSATWNLSPPSNNWNSAANWTPMVIPDGFTDTATFAVSNQTAVGVFASTQIGSIVFTPAANSYTITVQPASILTIGGAGIDNQTSLSQILTEAEGPFGSAPGVLQFVGNSSAGTAKVITPGGASNFALGGTTTFTDTSTADHAVLTATGAKGAGSSSGVLIFLGNSTAAESTVTAAGGTNSDAGSGGFVVFTGHASAGNAILTSQHSVVLGAFGGEIQFSEGSTAGNATLIATGGFGIPGFIAFFNHSSGGKARCELFDGGGLELDFHQAPGVTVGSIEGNGSINLGSSILTSGSNDLTTTYSGNIEDGGAGGGLAKIGHGSLTLSGSSTYSGETTIRSGTLLVDTPDSSGTGSGPVVVAGGTLGGSGVIGGSVTVGTPGGESAQLYPGANHGAIAELSIGSDLFFAPSGSFVVRLDPSSMAADEVVANGVTISAGARLRLLTRPGALTPGTSFVLIDNISGLPIIGTFSNLGDGTVITEHGNNLLANYEGGDGNDLTLTVVP